MRNEEVAIEQEIAIDTLLQAKKTMLEIKLY